MSRHSGKGAPRGSKRAFAMPGALVFSAAVLVLLLTACQFVPTTAAEDDDAPQAMSTSTSANQDALQAEESAPPAMSEQMQSAQQAVEGLVAPYGTSVAVSVMPVDGATGFSINGDEQFVAASMIKLAVLAEYMRQVDEGTLDGQSTYALERDDIVGGTGIMQENSPGTPFTYEQLARYMIMYSDNTATNVLIDTMGRDAVNERAREFGLAGTSLNRRMMRTNEGPQNLVTANDCATLLCQIAQGTLASEQSCKLAEDYLLAQVDNEALSLGLPPDVGFGHKTGSLSSARHDGGIVYSENPYVIVVLTSLDEASANALMADISKAVYEALQ